MAHQDRLDMVLILGHALSRDLEQLVVLTYCNNFLDKNTCVYLAKSFVEIELSN